MQRVYRFISRGILYLGVCILGGAWGIYTCHWGKLRLERGGEDEICVSSTKTVIYWLIYEISRHIIHQKIAYFQAY